MARGLEPLNRPHKSQDALMDQVVKQNARWKPAMNSLCDVLNLRKLID
jgi:hypothetical protein